MTTRESGSTPRLWPRIGASIGLVALCFSLVRPEELIGSIAQIRPWYFMAALVLNVIGTILIRAWIARLTNRASGLTLSFGELVRINLVARFYTLALPRGASAAVRWHHYRQGGSGHTAAALVMFESLVSILTLFLSAAVILGVEYGNGGQATQWLLPFAWCGTLLSAFMLLPFLHHPTANLFHRPLQRLLQRPGRIPGLADKLLDAVEAYHSISSRRAGSILCASLLGYAFFVLSAWVLAEGMMLGVSLAAIAWVRSVTLLVALIPITIAGIGLREGTIIALLHDYGVSPSAAFAYAIASFTIQLVLGLVGAGLETIRLMGEKKKVGNRPSNEETT